MSANDAREENLEAVVVGQALEIQRLREEISFAESRESDLLSEIGRVRESLADLESKLSDSFTEERAIRYFLDALDSGELPFPKSEARLTINKDDCHLQRNGYGMELSVSLKNHRGNYSARVDYSLVFVPEHLRELVLKMIAEKEGGKKKPSRSTVKPKAKKVAAQSEGTSSAPQG